MNLMMNNFYGVNNAFAASADPNLRLCTNKSITTKNIVLIIIVIIILHMSLSVIGIDRANF